MPLYQITDDVLSPLVSTSFQEENLWERRDLQRLLRANIEVIAADVMVICTGLLEPDTLMRDNNRQTLRCHYESETHIQAIF